MYDRDEIKQIIDEAVFMAKYTVYGKLYQKFKKDYIECGTNVVLIITG